MKTATKRLPKNKLGSTGLKVSTLGMGGFHQCEVDSETVSRIAARYIALGGNFVETARSYGNGASEIKLGAALRPYRDKLVIASKTVQRDADGAWRELNETLENLQTDHLDLYFFHNISKLEDATMVAGRKGALKTFERARDEGLVKHFAISSHWPALLPELAKIIPYEAAMLWGNYLDFCNYPEVPETVLPELRERGIGIMFMKPLADGYLYRSATAALRYSLCFKPDILICGFNHPELLEIDAAAIAQGPLNDAEKAALLAEAPELGRYVCRQCPACAVLSGQDGKTLKALFELEGKFDRQMDDFLPVDASTYALRRQLAKWFGNAEYAQKAFKENASEFCSLLEIAADESQLQACHYGIAIARKIYIACAKLSGGNPEKI